MGSPIHSFHDTFWNRKRVEAGITQRELAELLKVSDSTVSNWLTGLSMPENDMINKFCELFDVDFPTAHTEFYKAHKSYVAKKHLGNKYAVVGENKSCDKSDNKADNKPDIFEIVYGKLSYNEFNKFVELCGNKTDNPLRCIYGKVDFDEYNRIADILKEN